MGLDLAERLIADASVLEGRLAKRVVADEDRGELDELEKQICRENRPSHLVGTMQGAGG
ncbi:MAG TPA: hypothetical protein VJ783_09520 [Pirellulales bacterium]|nr:hypothetical protein [Pirellulales bacterium]